MQEGKKVLNLSHRSKQPKAAFWSKSGLKVNPGDEACSESYLQSCFKNYVLFKHFMESLFLKRPIPHCTEINNIFTNSRRGVSNVSNSTGHSAGSEQIPLGVFGPLWGLCGSLSMLLSPWWNRKLHLGKILGKDKGWFDGIIWKIPWGQKVAAGFSIPIWLFKGWHSEPLTGTALTSGRCQT